MSEKMDRIQLKALHAIDGLCLLTDVDRRLISRLAHYAVNVNCRVNHPDGGEEIEQVYNAMVEMGMTKPIKGIK